MLHAQVTRLVMDGVNHLFYQSVRYSFISTLHSDKEFKKKNTITSKLISPNHLYLIRMNLLNTKYPAFSVKYQYKYYDIDVTIDRMKFERFNITLYPVSKQSITV